MRSPSFSVFAFVFTLTVGLVGCKGADGDTCKENNDCSGTLVCCRVGANERGSCGLTCDTATDSGPLDSGPTVDSGPIESDAAIMSDAEAMTDAGADAGPDAAETDSGPADVGVDANAEDAGTDAGSDADTDAGATDAGPDADAGMTDAGPDADAA